MGGANGDRAIEQGTVSLRAYLQGPDTADGNHLAIQHGDAVDLWQGTGIFAQPLGRLGKMARTEGAREEVFDRIGV